jgi:RNA 2',3'-cyclic 3'-phosphodiesterase
MTNLMRTFIAVKVEPEMLLLQILREMQKAIAGEPFKWVEENNLHLTLKFLGDTSPDQMAEVSDILDSVSRKFKEFSCRLQGIGYFKSRGMPRVLFVKIVDAEILEQLTNEFNSRLAGIGFEPDPRGFSPHLTLARIRFLKNKKAFYQTVGKYRDDYIQQLIVRELIFYQSILNDSGPVYKPLAVKELTGPTDF